jgi:type VI secretion system protein ImpE
MANNKAEERLRAGNLADTLTELQAEVRAEPANPEKRVFLFQLLCLLGRWDRALTQLQVLSDLDPKMSAMVQTYGPALKCEELRAEVFSGKKAPMLFGKPEEWMALLLEGVRLTGEGKHEEAGGLRARAFEAAPATAGSIIVSAGMGPAGGEEVLAPEVRFEWMADADGRLGPMLEAVVNARYYWIPYRRLKKIAIDRPSDLRDLVWTPCTLTLANGGETVALIPTRYPGSQEGEDPIRLARQTTWTEAAPDTFLGLGQRLLATDQGEYPLLEVRTVVLEGVDEPTAA